MYSFEYSKVPILGCIETNEDLADGIDPGRDELKKDETDFAGGHKRTHRHHHRYVHTYAQVHVFEFRERLENV